ncbi:MAG: beta-lactamase [Acidobacteria bacterium]|nr:beta-lactamase [Acidobacteriota bacterium]
MTKVRGGRSSGRWFRSGVLRVAFAAAFIPIVLAGQTASTAESKVDAIFAQWTSSTPGCVVGVATNGTPVLAKGYGMADLEHDVPLSPDSILEPGSVTKQFTAAAVMVLARDGKLSLDDQVRQYIPELPDYHEPLTIRHMLSHTSGLRDWGNVAAIAGWARTTRVHTHAHVLDIVSRQRALNFTPGTHWSYSNTGFNLAAMIVQRVGGVPFPEFTRTRLFEPLGMTHTSWRDDYTRIVKGRALAYSERDGAFHTDMPFENVYGNGGLLTTAGDLLKWNEHYDAPAPSDAAMVAEQQQAGHFNDGRAHGYGLGLFVGSYQGLREVYHSGSTAGYQAFLTRFPDQRVSVAVLCNSSGAPATQYAHAVADVYLGGRVKIAPPAARPSDAEIAAAAGLYRSTLTGVAVLVGGGKDTLRGRRWTFDGHGGALAADESAVVSSSMTAEHYERVPPAHYTDAQLARFAGVYASDEAETVLTAAIHHHALVLTRRPDTTVTLTPTYADAFTADHGLGTVIFRRDAAARATELDVVQDRVWNMRFHRLPR